MKFEISLNGIFLKSRLETEFFSPFIQSNEAALIGQVIDGPSLIIRKDEEEIANISIQELEENYKGTFKNY